MDLSTLPHMYVNGKLDGADEHSILVLDKNGNQARININDITAIIN